MAWTTPATASAGSTALTAAFWNEQVRDNSAYLKAEADSIGLTYINKKTFTSGASTTFDGIFTSEFTNYKILARGGSDQNNIQDLYMDLRAAGSDVATSQYYRIGTYNNNTTGPARFYTANTNGFTVGFVGNFVAWSTTIDLFAPFLTSSTQMVGSGTGWGNSSSASGVFQGALSATTSCDGIKLRAGAGNIDGTIWVYGYNAG